MLHSKTVVVLDEETAKKMKEERLKNREESIKSFLRECEPIVEEIDLEECE
jgi:hypothetical protein